MERCLFIQCLIFKSWHLKFLLIVRNLGKEKEDYERRSFDTSFRSSFFQCMLQFLHVVMDYFGRFLPKPHSLNHSLPAYALLGLPKYPTSRLRLKVAGKAIKVHVYTREKDG